MRMNRSPLPCGGDLAKQFVNTQLHMGVLARKFRKAQNAELGATVIGKLRRILASDLRRQVAPLVGRTVLQTRIGRFALCCGRFASAVLVGHGYVPRRGRARLVSLRVGRDTA